MKNTVSITAFVLLALAMVAILGVTAFSEAIRQANWIDPEVAASACFVLAILGTVLGAASFERPLGKTAAILGILLIVAFLAQVFWYEGGSPNPPSHLRDRVPAPAE